MHFTYIPNTIFKTDLLVKFFLSFDGVSQMVLITEICWECVLGTRAISETRPLSSLLNRLYNTT